LFGDPGKNSSEPHFLTPGQSEVMPRCSYATAPHLRLSNKIDIFIRKSDKGDNVVESTKRYIDDGLEHLSNEEVYHRLPSDITQQTHDTIISFIEHCFGRGLLNRDIYQFLKSAKELETPTIYFLQVTQEPN